MFVLAAEISLRILAAAVAVGLVLVVLRVRSGAARHAAWSAVLLAMLGMPGLMAIVPHVEVPLPSIPARYFAEIADEREPFAHLDTPLSAGSASLQPAATSAPAFPAMGKVNDSSADWRFATLALYAAGALLFFVRIVVGWILGRRLVARAVRVPYDNRALVFESAAIATPLTAGIVSPCVLLPVTWRGWPADKLLAVMAHENAHIARRDSLIALLAHTNRAIFWFHPLSWWLERTLAATAEQACDETAARQVQPRRYAEVLLEMADAVRVHGRRVSWHTIGVDGSPLLDARINRLLKGGPMLRMSTIQRVVVAAACAAVLFLAIACRQRVAVEPLRPDAAVQKQIDDNNARNARHRAALAM